MTTIAVDGLNEEAFRRSIENRLRQGLASEAIGKLRELLAPFAGPGRILPERFLTVQASDLTLTGWDQLGQAVAIHDRPGWRITALSIAFGWPGEDLPQPDPTGCLRPLLETSYFSDESFPFSQSARDDLLDGYSYHGCTWSSDSVATDSRLSLEGIDDLHGALAALEARLLDSDEPDEDEIRAGSLGACLLSALLIEAVGARIAQDGLPRPLCVLAGSNGVYPYFDAPVIGMPADVLKADDEDSELLGQVPAPRYSSLLVTGIPRARKRAVLVLDENEDEKAVRTANLRSQALGEAVSAQQLIAKMPDGPSLQLSEAGIIPMANGPLLAKKPAGKSWDFRDMLGPRDSDGADLPLDLPSQAELPPKPDQQAPEPPLDTADDFRQVELPAPRLPLELDQHAPEPPLGAADDFRHTELPTPRLPRLPRTPLPQPGFALLEEGLGDRQEALFTPELAVPVPSEPDPAAFILEQPEQAESPQVPIPPADPAWPLGIGWLEDIEAPAAADDASDEIQESPGLWARLRRWLGRR